MAQVVLHTNTKETVPRSSGDDTLGRHVQVRFLMGEKRQAKTSGRKTPEVLHCHAQQQHL